MIADTVSIYALRDPRDNAVRYVGKTTMVLRRRLSGHMIECVKQRHHRASWLRQLKALGFNPEIMLLEAVSINDWCEAERRWIAHFIATGSKLTNGTTGGDGGTVFSPEARANLSAAKTGKPAHNKGKKASPEAIANMSANSPLKGKPGLRKGATNTAEHRAKISAAKKGKPNFKKRGQRHTPEARARISAGHMGQVAWNKGKKMSPEFGANLSKLMKGKTSHSKGKKFSEQACTNIGASKKGKKLSEQHKAAMSACRIGKPHPNKRRTSSPQLPPAL